MENKKRKIAYSSLLTIFIFLILLGIGGMLLNHSGLHIHTSGREVAGTVVNYNVYKPPRRPAFNCTLYCEYKDISTGKVYRTETTYSKMWTFAQCEEWCESQVDGEIALVIDNGGHCIASRDKTFDLVKWIFFPRAIFIIVGTVGIIVIVIKKFYFDKEVDYSPKFVKQSSPNDPLTLVWQKNSNNNILSVGGENSIWYSSLNSGKWNEAKKLYETDKYISFVDSAYVKDTLTSAFLEEGDNDLTTNDRVVLAVNTLGESTTLPINSETVNNPQFVKTNNTVKLYVFNEGGIVYSEDFDTINELLSYPELINDTYKIYEDESRLVIYYNKVMEENGVQTFACIYNKEFNIWQKDVLLTDAEYNIMNSSVVILQNGDLLTIYNEYDQDNEINRLGYNLKQMKKDFAISTVFYDLDTVNNEEFTLNIGITNIGDYPLSTFEVSAFGKEEQIVLEEPIALNKTHYFKITRTFNVSDNGFEEIILKSDSIQKVYLLPVSYVDVSIEGVSRYDGLIQHFDLTLANNTDSDVEVLLDVYYMGELLETIDIKLNAESLYSYSYSNTEFKNDNFVYFILRTPNQLDKYESDNDISFKVSGMLEQSPVFNNPYASVLQSALNLI